MDLNAPSDIDKDKKDDKREETDKDEAEIPSIIGVIASDSESNCDSDNDSEDEDERGKDVDQTPTEPINMNRDFFSGLNGIFTKSNEDDDYTGEENDNTPTNSNSNQTIQNKKGKKHVRVSKKKNKLPHTTNPAIKYKNNKKKKRKKVKPRTSKPKKVQATKIVLIIRART